MRSEQATYGHLENKDEVITQADNLFFAFTKTDYKLRDFLEKQYNVKIKFDDLKDDKVAGKSSATNRIITINNRANLSLYEKRYVMLHELAHILFPSDNDQYETIKKEGGRLVFEDNERERRANLFAMNAIAQEKWFLLQFMLYGDNAEKAAKSFQMPEYLAKQRFIDLKDILYKPRLVTI